MDDWLPLRRMADAGSGGWKRTAPTCFSVGVAPGSYVFVVLESPLIVSHTECALENL